jgi:regulatory protein
VDEVTCGATITELERFGFVDDLAFARWWLEQRDRHSPRGRRGIEAELRQHGVERETIAALRLDEGESRGPGGEDLPSTEEDRAIAALARHLGDRRASSDRRELQRLVAYLVRRGFGTDVAWTAVRQAAGAVDEATDGET